MKLEKIITLASTPVRLRFLAMVRSLRETGCDLPVWVIPYGDAPGDRFPLPEGCEWWVLPEVIEWSNAIRAHRMTRKYQCYLTANYQYADSDVIFLRNPAEVLQPTEGFVASCGHWRDPDHTQTAQSLALFRRHSTNWQREVFNAGQFACDRALFADFEAIRAIVQSPEHSATCLLPISEQPGINLLRLLSGVPICNVTLPPMSMESTWAGDYRDAHFEGYWQDAQKRPYMIHWAGMLMNVERPIDELFYGQLTSDERAEWDALVREKARAPRGVRPRLQGYKRRAMRMWDALQDG